MLDRYANSALAAEAAGPWLMVAEFEHRVANEYALAVASLSLAAARSSSLEAKSALQATAQRLRDYAELHRALQAPRSDGPFDLAEYLRGLCAAMTRAKLDERGVSLTLIEQSIDLPAVQCWRVGLIVDELVNNALRHGLKGHGGRLLVEIVGHGGRLDCRLHDDGAATVDARPGRGTAVVDALAGELGGAVRWWFGAHGTTVVLSFPVAAPLGHASSVPRPAAHSGVEVAS